MGKKLDKSRPTKADGDSRSADKKSFGWGLPVLVAVLSLAIGGWAVSRPGGIASLLRASSSAVKPAACCQPLFLAGKNPQRVAIVATVWKSETVLWQFLCYHFSIGIDHVFLVVDSGDKDDPQVEIARQFGEDRVTIWLHNEDLDKEYQKLNMWKKFGPFRKTEVMARQLLNMELALRHSIRKKIDWLLSIDSDELFFTKDISIRRHFSRLARANAHQGVYLNYEGVPEKMESDFFVETSLFKRNMITYDLSGRMTQEQHQWANARRRGVYQQGYFTGKAAVRVPYDNITEDEVCLYPNICPWEVTRFFGAFHEVRHNFDGPLILHYINPTFPWTYQKYAKLKKFSDKVYDHNEDSVQHVDRKHSAEESTALPHHKYVRDVIWRADGTLNSDLSAVKREYRTWGMLDGKQETDAALQTGLLAYLPEAGFLIEDLMKCESEGRAVFHDMPNLAESKNQDRLKHLQARFKKKWRKFKSDVKGKVRFTEHQFVRPTQCTRPEFCSNMKMCANVTCHVGTDCCAMLRQSKGALKVYDKRAKVYMGVVDKKRFSRMDV
ncbi:uncharacterized protein LOC135822644 [Sycon ciliatum]|uniref:uncharacterized protein LOC135822644 n=1 Tax=Sycon ciliatum TaxID=27933 RepID=UPI0031F6F68F